MRKSLLAISFFIMVSSLALGQKPRQLHSGEIKQALKRLNVFGSMLYLAAHPDDENTRMIAFYANEKLYKTAYLSCTRGDGGQNLVGPEIRELLGIIRTQELLAARRTDGGNQYFTRANDFGYSKTADETLQIWNKDQVLSDIVWTIRKLRPDVIITRFPPDERAGHGHHTASAILGIEAFSMVNDPDKFPEQLEYVEPWQPKRIVFNTHPFFFQRRGLPFDSTQYVSIQTGQFNPLLGKSYGEIAAESRTNHKSQGFGSTGTRGDHKEWLKLLDGEPFNEDPFEDIDTTPQRINGSSAFSGPAESAYLNFDPSRPWMVLPDLLEAKRGLGQMKDPFWRSIKEKELTALIKAISGLYIEIKSSDYAYTPGDSISLSVEAINRSSNEIVLKSLNFNQLGDKVELNQALVDNKPFILDKSTIIPEDYPYSQPYWLREKSTLGMYKVDEQQLRGLPENEPAFLVEATIMIEDQYFDYDIPVIYKRNDPVDGEQYRPVEVGPAVMVNIQEKVYVFADDEPREIQLSVKSNRDNLSGKVMLALPTGWKSTPEDVAFNLELKGSESTASFMVYPPDTQESVSISAVVQLDNQMFTKGLTRIEYDHIPTQTLYPESGAKVVKLDIERRGQNIGYIPGAGDEIPSSLEQIGYRVWELKDEEITKEKLADFDAVILGVRAYNTVDRLKFHQSKLMEYVENGGTVIVQYNTSFRLVTEEVAPYPLKISRDRVSVEDAEIRILKPEHEVLNFPNKITALDFDNWVQERGLYFPSEWSEEFEAILSSNDPGEDPKNGGLLVAEYGEGYYIYTGYSWFRQLPAGVSGAYRLFTNMISIGKDNIQTGDSGSGK